MTPSRLSSANGAAMGLNSTRDWLEIHELMAAYGHLLDDQAWDRLDELFTEDVIYDATDFGLGVMRGIAAVRAAWSTFDFHPIAHHATNLVVEQLDGDAVTARSKGLGVGKRGRVGSVMYEDLLRRTDAGWRIAKRVARLRVPRQPTLSTN